MLVEQMPIVRKVLADAQQQIVEMTGLNVKITIEAFPTGNTEEMLLLISDLVSMEFCVSWEAMKGKKRYRRNGLLDARHTFMYVAHKVMGFSSPETGRYIGGKDHTNVLHACNKIQGFIEVSDPVSIKINNVIKRLPLCV